MASDRYNPASFNIKMGSKTFVAEMAICFFATFLTQLSCTVYVAHSKRCFVGIDYFSFSKTQTCTVVMVLQFQSVCFGTFVCPDRTRLNKTEYKDYGRQP